MFKESSYYLKLVDSPFVSSRWQKNCKLNPSFSRRTASAAKSYLVVPLLTHRVSVIAFPGPFKLIKIVPLLLKGRKT
jgi:hypothetical protein